MRVNRPSWDDIWMRMAHIVATRSIDPRLAVGAVVVTADNSQVLAIGYNGQHAGGPNTVDSEEPGESGLIHAEINALIKLDFNNPQDKTLYVTDTPCVHCAKCIVNAGIKSIVYDRRYRNDEGYLLLLDSGISLRRHSVSRDDI